MLPAHDAHRFGEFPDAIADEQSCDRGSGGSGTGAKNVVSTPEPLPAATWQDCRRTRGHEITSSSGF